MKHSSLFLGVFLVLVAVLAALSFGSVDTGEIDTAVYDAFDEAASDEPVRVIVILNDDLDDGELNLLSGEDKKEIAKDLQKNFLDDLASEVDVFGDSEDEVGSKKLLSASLGESENTDKKNAKQILKLVDSGLMAVSSETEEMLNDEAGADVVVLRKFEENSVLTLEVNNENSLDELLSSGKVSQILLDEEVSITLDDSVPLINADDVWNYDSVGDGTGSSMTGLGETVCVIDTGIDYTHSALGACSITNYTTSGVEENLSAAVESDHPYSNSIDETYTINMSGYENIAVHFDYINLESPGEAGGDSTDRVYVYNENNETLAVYKGNHSDIWTPSASGSILYVRIITDSSVTSDGFYIDSVLNGTTNMTTNWSSCSKVIGGYDVYNNDGDPMDDHGHGTHVAGIVASTDATYSGVAPNASLLALKAMDSSGNGYISDVAAAVEWCVSNAETYNVSVISMSIGGGQTTSYCDSTYGYFSDIVGAANAKNISVVVATGNTVTGYTNNSAGIAYPSCIENVIRVTATDKSDIMASYAFRNLFFKDILAAPGSSITSANDGGGFVSNSGTSMATPTVAGAIALMNQYAKAAYGQVLTPEQIENKLFLTGVNIDDEASSGNNYSRIDVLAAVQPYLNYTATTVANGTISTNGSFVVNISSDVNLSTAILEVDSGSLTNYSMFEEGQLNENYYYSYTISGLSTGNYTFLVYGNDSLNTLSQTDSRTMEVSINSSIEILVPADQSYYNEAFTFLAILESSSGIISSNYTIYNASDNSVLQFEENNSVENTIINWSALVNVTNSTFGEGNYTLEVSALDGNGTQISDSVTFVVDLTGPVVSDLEYSPSIIYTNDTVEFLVNVTDDAINTTNVILEVDTKSGLTNYTMVVGDVNYFNFSFDAFNNLSGGDNVSTQVYAYDLAGNMANNSLMYFSVENLPLDTVTITAPTNGTVIELSNATIFTATANDSDNDTMFTYFWDFNVTGANTTGNDVEYTYSEEGTYTVTATVSDFNSSAESTTVVIVNDSYAPTLTSISWGNYTLSSGSTKNATVIIEAFDYSNFSAINLYDHDGTLIIADESDYNSATWKFGDYTEAGTYNFTIELIDNSSNLNTLNVTEDVIVTLSSSSGSSSSSESSSSGSGGGGGGSSTSTSSSDDSESEEDLEVSEETDSTSDSDSEVDTSSSSSSSSSSGNGDSGSLSGAQKDNVKEESLFSRMFGGDGLSGAISGLGLTTGNTLVGVLIGFVVLLSIMYFIVRPKGGY